MFFDIISVFATTIDLADKNLQRWHYSATGKWDVDRRFRAKFEIFFNGHRKMVDQLYGKSKDLGDMLRLLPGVVVQKHMSIQGMADLYRIKPNSLEHLIQFFFEPQEQSPSHYILDSYLSDFLKDRDRSKHYYCDPILQHISVCRHILSLLDECKAFDLQL